MATVRQRRLQVAESAIRGQFIGSSAQSLSDWQVDALARGAAFAVVDALFPDHLLDDVEVP